MSVTEIRPPRPRSKKDQAHDAELIRLASKVAQIRYACDVLAQQPAPLTVQAVRTWLAEHGVAEDPGNSKRRRYVSRIVNDWRRDRESNHPSTPAQSDLPSGSDSDEAAPTPMPGETAPSRATSDPDPALPPRPAPDLTDAEPAPLPADVRAPLPAPDPAAPARDSGARPVPRAVPRPVPRTLDPTANAPDASPAHLSAPSPTPDTDGPEPHLVARSRRLRFASYLVLSAVAAAGAALSYQSLETAAQEVFPKELARMFPLLVDALIVGASLAYLAGAVIGRGRAGWRLTAHVGVGGTIFLNALAAESVATVPWHIAAPIVWAALVELTARDLLGDYRAVHARTDSIPFALWLTAPGESASTWLRVRRQAAHATVRVDVGAHAAAREALRMALPGHQGRRVRRVISRQLRAGSVTPAAVVAQSVAIMGDVPATSAKAVLRDVLSSAVGVPPTEKPTPAVVAPQTGPFRAGGGLVKARPQDIDQLRTAIASSHPRGSASSPNKPSRNPYIEITPEPAEAPEDQSRESISVVTQESTTSKQQITSEQSSEKSEELQTYATALT